jgi:hypothetical protein
MIILILIGWHWLAATAAPARPPLLPPLRSSCCAR